MLVLSISRLFASVFSLGTIAAAQTPHDLPLDEGTRRFLEVLPPEKQADILREFGKALAGQVPASPDIIEAQELIWSYGRSPPFYPTRESKLPSSSVSVGLDFFPFSSYW